MKGNKTIMLHLGGGVGNVIQATPMIRSLSGAGYIIDLCIQADFEGVADLFRGWSAIRGLSSTGEEFLNNSYDYYIVGLFMTRRPLPFRDVKKTVFLRLDYSHRDIDIISEADLYLNAARAIEPEVDVSRETYCGKSQRAFPEISSATCVLAPGGKFVFPLKKWDRFDILAARFRDVSVVGIEKDLDISNSRYFPYLLTAVAKGYLNNRTLAWRLLKVFSKRTARKMRFGKDVKTYLGKLSLTDTAALIDRAGFFIGNDCGPAHISIALGKPTFVLMGPSSTRKNYAHFKNVHPISLDYECRPCQEKMHDDVFVRLSAARHFCPYGIRCLRDMSVDYVYNQVSDILLKQYGFGPTSFQPLYS